MTVLGDRVADTHIADLILCFLNSLHLRRVCNHTETFSFILLEILPVKNLRNKHDHVRNTPKKVKTQYVSHSEQNALRSQMNTLHVFV